MMTKETQIGCGYCSFELMCSKHDPKINKAKLGCEEWLHFKDDPDYIFDKQKHLEKYDHKTNIKKTV